ncbi:MAG: endonuclease [Flavobacterium sp.]
MNKIYTLFSLFIAQLILAQPPQGYYEPAENLSGFQLKTALYNIIKDHNDQTYSAIDNFFVVADLDIYYENDGTILDPYSENPAGEDPYNFDPFANPCGNYSGEGDCYNKEHVIPQSVFSQNNPMRGDAHHLLPTDGRVNGFRSNFPFGTVGNSLVSQAGITNPTQNGSKLGNSTVAGFSGTVFEPINEFKGDIARIYFYFVTRYEDLVGNWSSFPMFNGSSNQAIATPFLNLLYQWHLNDPVSEKEIARNNAIYQYQGNRNPFVDFPEWVCEVWNVNNCTLSADDFSTPNVAIYPNPSMGSIFVQSTEIVEKITIYSLEGKLIQNIENPSFDGNVYQISNLKSGFYFLNCTIQGQMVTEKIMVQ